MAAKPIETLELRYPMRQFFLNKFMVIRGSQLKCPPFLSYQFIMPDLRQLVFLTCFSGFFFLILSTVSLLSVEYHPKISEERSTDSNHFRDFTKTAYHLLTTTHILDRSSISYPGASGFLVSG